MPHWRSQGRGCVGATQMKWTLGSGGFPGEPLVPRNLGADASMGFACLERYPSLVSWLRKNQLGLSQTRSERSSPPSSQPSSPYQASPSITSSA